MKFFKKASELIDKSKNNSFPPEIMDVIKFHLLNSDYNITITSSLLELNKRGLNPSRNTIKRYLDNLADSGMARITKKGNVLEYECLIRKKDRN